MCNSSENRFNHVINSTYFGKELGQNILDFVGKLEFTLNLSSVDSLITFYGFKISTKEKGAGFDYYTLHTCTLVQHIGKLSGTIHNMMVDLTRTRATYKNRCNRCGLKHIPKRI